jgi:hypothetical protein
MRPLDAKQVREDALSHAEQELHAQANKIMAAKNSVSGRG